MAGVYVQREVYSMVRALRRKKDCAGRPGLWRSAKASLEWCV